MAYSPTNTYATIADIQKRTSSRGWINAADMDGDGSVSTEELSNAEDCIETVNNMIDAALTPFFSDCSTARQSGNEWLRDRCIELSLYKIMGMGGRDIAETIANDYDDALKMLNQVRTGDLLVPCLVLPTPDNYTGQSRRVPRAANVSVPRRRAGR
jgi:phage gp36-like protein